MKKERLLIDTSKLLLNEGQLEWLPSNPRTWTRQDLDKMKASIERDPDFLEDRPALIVPYTKGKFIVFGGNMRTAACEEMNRPTIPAMKYIPETDDDRETIKRRAVLDNGSFGAWDFDELANKWDDLPLTDWGVPAWNLNGCTGGGEGDAEKKKTEILSGLQYDPLYYEPKNKPELRLADCINDEKFRAKIATLDEYQLTDEQKATLRMFAYRFLKIDFEAVANYYFFNATEEEKKAMERLRLVLVDNGSLGGFVEDAMIRISDLSREEALNNGDED